MDIKNISHRPWVKTQIGCKINGWVSQIVLTPDQKIGFLTRKYEKNISKFYLTDKYCRKVEAKIKFNYRLFDVGVIDQDNFYLSNITTFIIIQLSGKSFKIINQVDIENSGDSYQSLIYIGNSQFLKALFHTIQKIDLTTEEVKQIGEFSEYIDGWLTLLDDTKIAVSIDEEIQCMDIITGKIEKPFEIPETIKQEELTLYQKEVSKDKNLLFASFYHSDGYEMAFVCWNVSTRTIRYITFRKSLFDLKDLYLDIVIYNKDYTILHRNCFLIVVNNKTGEFVQVVRFLEPEECKTMLVLAPKLIMLLDGAEFLTIRG